MRSFGVRLTLLVAILWGMSGSTVWALGFHGDAVETVYVMPSSVSLAVPTSYVVSTSWVEPTAYAVPTYYTTAYWMDPVVVAQPAYTATTYVRRGGLFGRRWVVERPVLATYATSYVPTTYYTSRPIYRTSSYVVADPLLMPTAYVTSAECVCPPAVASAAPTYAAPSRGTVGGGSGTGTGARSRSDAHERGSISSNVPPAEDLRPAGPGGTAGEANTGAGEATPNTYPDIPAQPRDTSPPPPPAPAGPRPGASGSGGLSSPGNAAGTGTQGQPAGATTTTRPRTGGNVGGANVPSGNAGATGNAPARAGTGGNAGAAAPPTAPNAPPDELPAPPPIAPPGTEGRRDSLKPSTYLVRPIPGEFRNVLMGTVSSRSAGEPEEDVRVSLRNLRTGTRKSATTNAFGRFAVRLTDGDWAVDVTMPSGRVYEVSRLQVSDGLIVDNLGRRIPSLDITR